MIFDSAPMARLREKYSSTPKVRWLRIVHLDRAEGGETERKLFEELIQLVPLAKQRDWLGRLVNVDDAQYLGAKFEILFYGWLRQQGDVEVEPKIEGNDPDFAVTIGDQRIIIEARAVLIDKSQRVMERRRLEIMVLLNEIERPYQITIRGHEARADVEPVRLLNLVRDWLDKSPGDPFTYLDEYGNRIVFEAKLRPGLDKVIVFGGSGIQRVTGKPIRRPLAEKANQHRALRQAGHPYIIAIWLEPELLSAEEVAEAWFGEQIVTIDVNSAEVVKQSLDKTGIHFMGQEVRHRTVSGTLVFKYHWNSELEHTQFAPYYIENPYANIRLDPMLFQTVADFVVADRRPNGLSLEWRQRTGEK